MGSMIATLNKLNISCTVAPANALRNSFLSAICPMATMVLVTEVPIFDPMMIGIAGRTSKTETDNHPEISAGHRPKSCIAFHNFQAHRLDHVLKSSGQTQKLKRVLNDMVCVPNRPG